MKPSRFLLSLLGIGIVVARLYASPVEKPELPIPADVSGVTAL
jgi:hypothetical protein